MQPRGHQRTRARGRGWHGAVAVVVCVGSAVLAANTGDGVAVAATLLVAGDVRRRNGLTGLVGWLLGGSLVGAVLGYAATAWIAGFPLATQSGVGLGVALGGGIGVVSNLLAADASRDGGGQAESMTVDMETDRSPSPRPADLFEDHPDPVLYVADQGHGPVVLAANAAFAETFDVPADAISGTPLDEALLASDDATASAVAADLSDAVDDDGRVERTLACETPAGTRQFRVRAVGRGTDGYVIYSQVDGAA